MVGLVVPVMKNFKGFARLMASVDYPVRPYVINNWDYNHGVSKAWNAGIDWAMDEDLVIVCNDDVIFHPGTIKTLVNQMADDQDIDLCSVVSTDTEQYGFHEADFPDFACYIIQPRDFTDKFGTFDENFTPAYFEDNDMAYRIKLAGGKQGLCLHARVEHEGSATQFMDNEPVVSSQRFELNRDYYMAKWGGIPHEEKHTTPFNSGRSIKDW